MDKSSIEVAKTNYVARMDELSRQLDAAKADLQQTMQENVRLKEVEHDLRDNLYDCDNELSRLEGSLEKEEQKNHLLRVQNKRLRQRETANGAKIIQLHEEIKALHKPYLHLPAGVTTAQAPPAFADEDEDVFPL